MKMSKSGLIAVASATCDKSVFSSIYIIDAYTFLPLYTLRLHDRGVQDLDLSDNGDYLVSCGNFKENRVVVWDLEKQSALAQSKLQFKINEVKTINRRLNTNNIIEFVTIGGEQIIYWACNSDKELSRYSNFLLPVIDILLRDNFKF